MRFLRYAILGLNIFGRKKLMRWEVRKIENGWGIFLIQEFCKTSEPVCYGVAQNKESVLQMVDRLNNPIHVERI